jgi:methylglutaconyl-CoA hydratase
MSYGHKIEIDGRGVAELTLDRPEMHNAFNDELIAALHDSFGRLDADAQVRCLVIRGAGRSFCAGADLGWMKRAATFTRDENVADGMALGAMLKRLAELSKPTLALVHGNCFAGGAGLVACADVAVAVRSTVFSISEVRLGLVPATISPYLVEAMGARNCRRLFLTAERFSGADAARFGLVHEVVDDVAGLDAQRDRFVGDFLGGAAPAQHRSKRLIDAVTDRVKDDALVRVTAEFLADARTSPEAKEGLTAFFEKRKAAWMK